LDGSTKAARQSAHDRFSAVDRNDVKVLLMDAPPPPPPNPLLTFVVVAVVSVDETLLLLRVRWSCGVVLSLFGDDDDDDDDEGCLFVPAREFIL
jgi:hypothetical protein